MFENRNELVFDKSNKPRGMQDVFVELVNTYLRSGFLDASFDSETRNRMLNPNPSDRAVVNRKTAS